MTKSTLNSRSKPETFQSSTKPPSALDSSPRESVSSRPPLERRSSTSAPPRQSRTSYIRRISRNTPPPIEIVVIGVSAGGPNALAELVPNLSANLPVPVLIVQHMPPNFTSSLARSLDSKSQLHVIEAREGDPVKAGTVYMAPGGRHMEVSELQANPETYAPENMVIHLTDAPTENSCRPAADVLFRSVARYYQHILGIVMTGMGTDGLAGMKIMKQRDCYCLTQSQETCVIYGMPAAIDNAGLTDEQVPIKLFAQRINSIAKGKERAI